MQLEILFAAFATFAAAAPSGGDLLELGLGLNVGVGVGFTVPEPPESVKKLASKLKTDKTPAVDIGAQIVAAVGVEVEIDGEIDIEIFIEAILKISGVVEAESDVRTQIAAAIGAVGYTKGAKIDVAVALNAIFAVSVESGKKEHGAVAKSVKAKLEIDLTAEITISAAANAVIDCATPKNKIIDIHIIVDAYIGVGKKTKCGKVIDKVVSKKK